MKFEKYFNKEKQISYLYQISNCICFRRRMRVGATVPVRFVILSEGKGE